MLVVLGLLGPPAAALGPHGATYRPPRYDGPGDVTPEGTPPGAPPLPGDVGGGGASPRAPRTPGGGAGGVPSPPRPRGPLDPRRGVSPQGQDGDDPADWRRWWQLARDVLLDPRQRLLTRDDGFGSAGSFLGGPRDPRDPRARGGVFVPPDAALLRERVVPVLCEALAEERSADLTSACLLALARVADDLGEPTRERVEALLAARLPHALQEVSETAAVALGVLGRESSLERLEALAGDTRAGRALVGRPAVPQRTRAFACYALGLLCRGLRDEDGGTGARGARVARLLATLCEAQRDAARSDLAVACLLAFARTPWAPPGPPGPRSIGARASATRTPTAQDDERPERFATRGERARWLLEVLEDRRSRPAVRAHAAVALGWVLEWSDAQDAAAEPDGVRAERELALAALTRVLGSSGSPNALRRGAALALGRVCGLGPGRAQRRARTLLVAIDEHCADRATRCLARLALARTAARARRTLAAEVEEAERLRAVLERGLERETGVLRAWNALALGLLECLRARRGEGLAPSTERVLLRTLEAARAPDEVGALAVACALARAGDGRAQCAAWERVADAGTRALLLSSAGWTGARAALALARRTLASATLRPDLLREAALALGLCGTDEALRPLVQRLRASRSATAQAALARGLGRLGDRRAIEPLLELLADRGRPAGVRAFAAVALGLAGDRDRAPWNAPYVDGVLYLEAPPTLLDGLGGGLLELL